MEFKLLFFIKYKVTSMRNPTPSFHNLLRNKPEYANLWIGQIIKNTTFNQIINLNRSKILNYYFRLFSIFSKFKECVSGRNFPSK